MRSRTLFVTGIILLLALIPVSVMASPNPAMQPLSDLEKLGEFLYFDENLSEPSGQSCASCHDPALGFDEADDAMPVSEGVIPSLFGGRNSPISAYAMYSPTLYFDKEEGLWIGGQFWDGRATGAYLGDPLADQAVGPFMNPVEMANTSQEQVINDIKASEYADLFEKVWGKRSLNNVKKAYEQVGLSIAAFERTQLFAQFSSKYDAYLAACLANGGEMNDCSTGVGKIAAKAGKQYFSPKEWHGFQLFVGENDNDGILQKGEGAMCSACHLTQWTAVADYDLPVQTPAWAPAGWVPPVFTDFTYDNLGVPKSEHMLLVNNPVDLGLGGVLGDPAEYGKFKVMTVRNIGLSAPYAHNGYFMTLEEIVHFYNTRDVAEMNWPVPEVAETVNFDELGNLGLRVNDEAALVAFMETLSDGYMP
ncbi:MAG TPA: cytochrome c peroxidase [Anaerolineales bacterium]|nr:cytochrome c peroxidase [Anaerolineales bacterium]